ncbi:uncharacterized protein knl1 isoform X2 [Esox lucius]|uniref:uncharacterized protein knl1 isoform X2 n=1 Tax=Esox lucius TaxID=8010 RepID=UPI0014773A36|nr:uncharacterized protein knl1 isoform X2 [Esox lucius]
MFKIRRLNSKSTKSFKAIILRSVADCHHLTATCCPKMEPSEASRTDSDSVGSSKRRVSSILKAPRTSSVKFISPEREKSQVERVKPVEKKRISRRVSFATSNDVLLFSKDLKNGSPVRSPLQNLTKSAAENTSVQTGSINGSQPIAGMETLLNGPLHVSQKRTKDQFMLKRDDYGEKTVMFTGEDTTCMDMTHSHTVLIGNDSDCSVVLPHESNTSILTCGNMDFTFSQEKKENGYSHDSADNSAPFQNKSTSGRGMDPEFEHFLASLRKTRGPTVNQVTPDSSTEVAFHQAASPPERTDSRCFLATLNACMSGVDQENQVPAFSTAMRATVIPQMQSTQFKTTSVMHYEQDLMDLTKSHNTLIDGNGVFQSVPNITSEEQRLRESPFSLVSFSTDPDEMELTRSQTAAIDSKAIGMIATSPFMKTESVAFMSDPNKTQIFRDDDRDMEVTAALNASLQVDVSPLTKKVASSPWIFPKENDTTFQPNQQISHSSIHPNSDDMETTRCQTVAIDCKSLGLIEVPLQGKTRNSSFCMPSSPLPIDTKSLSVVKQVQKDKMKSISFMSEFNKGNHASENDCAMDLTKTLTLSKDHSNVSNMTDKTMGRLFPITKPQNKLFEKSVIRAEPTMDDKEFTRGHTGVIDTRVIDVVGEDEKCTERNRASTEQLVANVSFSAHGDDTFLRLSISSKTNFKGENDCSFVGHKTNLFLDSDDMDMTRSETAVIESDSIKMGNCDHVSARKPSVSGTLEMVPHLEQIANGYMFQLGTESRCSSEAPTFSDSEMERTKSQTIAIESRGINLTFVPQTDEALGNVTKISNGQEKAIEVNGVEKATHCRNNAEAVTSNMKEEVVISDETQVFSEDHEMTRAVTVQTEQHATTNEVVMMGPTTQAVSLFLPEPQLGHVFTNLTEHFDQKRLEDTNDPALNVEQPVIIPNKPVSFSISPSVSIENENVPSEITDQMSLADLQRKLDHISCTITISPDVMDSCAPPLSDLVKTSDKYGVETESLTTVNYGSKSMGGMTEKTASVELEDHIIFDVKSNMTPLKTKCLTSRVSFGGFLPKLPQRAKHSVPHHMESKSMTDFGKRIWKNNVVGTHHLISNTMMDNINDEVLPDISTEEDLSETVDAKSTQTVEDKVFEEIILTKTQGQKRLLPEEDHENSMDKEKRWKPSTENVGEMAPPTQVGQWDSNCTGTASDGSRSDANIRCEGTFETSTSRQNQLESQLEDTGDYMLDVRKKLQDGSITVTEFLKLFSIDFVIHKPRQSILPARVVSCMDCQTKDLLIEKHINRPKQSVYAMDCQKLTELVNGLKVRLRDRDNLLKNVNPTLWESVKGFSDEELQLFGAKLKERRTFFRKRSKVQSHEMKSVLYLNLVKTTQEAQHNLRGKIEKADKLLTDLDECIHDLEAELAAVEGTEVEDNETTLKARQQGLENVNKAIAEHERQICEIKVQERCTLNRVDRLQKEALEQEDHIAMLDRLNEWKFVEKDDRKTVYSFLYQSFLMEVHFEKSDGENGEENERNIMDIRFHRQMDDEKSQCHSRLVHNLLCQYIGSDPSFFKTYITSRYIPKLLHDVGLVVSRCRLLGEEIHLMKKWGALRLNILDISCVDTQVRILFSGLKTVAKFEMTIAIMSSYPFCLLQLQNFQNHIGNTTKEQVEDIISSVTPARNYLTKIVKKINENLLC